MGVQIHGDRKLSMAQHVHHPRGDTPCQKQRRTGVSQLVEPDPTHAGLLHQMTPGTSCVGSARPECRCRTPPHPARMQRDIWLAPCGTPLQGGAASSTSRSLIMVRRSAAAAAAAPKGRASWRRSRPRSARWGVIMKSGGCSPDSSSVAESLGWRLGQSFQTSHAPDTVPTSDSPEP